VSPALLEILGHKDNWVTTSTFLGHVTSSVMWPFDSPYTISYCCSIVTKPLSLTVFEILASKVPMLCKSSLRMRDITWPVPPKQNLGTYSNFPPPHCLFSMHFYWASMKNKGCLLVRPRVLSPKSSKNFLSPDQNWANVGGFGGLGMRGFKKFWFLPQKARPCVNPRCLRHFASKSVEGCDLQVGWGKNEDSHRKDMSPLTQGLNYRSARDRLQHQQYINYRGRQTFCGQGAVSPQTNLLWARHVKQVNLPNKVLWTGPSHICKRKHRDFQYFVRSGFKVNSTNFQVYANFFPNFTKNVQIILDEF